jgi:hypothetical protein
MKIAGRARSPVTNAVVRSFLALTGVTGMLWAAVVFPTFWSERVIVGVAGAIARGEVFDPDVLAQVEERTEGKGSKFRSDMLSKIAMIRLRQFENAVRADDAPVIQQRLESVTRIIRETLRNAPSDPFFWLAWFSLDTYREGTRPENVRYLRMSYELGPYEGWIAVKRDRAALESFSSLPLDLREQAISEFVRLVRWGINSEAADIAAGPARPLRAILFPKLKNLGDPQRRAFADVFYRHELDDVPVPEIPPPPAASMPVMPPE